MASFDFDIEGLKELSNVFDNMQNQINSFDGEISINKDYLLENVVSFNNSFSTLFNANSSDEEIMDYFKEQYSNIFQEHISDNVNYKDEFNAKYLGFAHID